MAEFDSSVEDLSNFVSALLYTSAANGDATDDDSYSWYSASPGCVSELTPMDLSRQEEAESFVKEENDAASFQHASQAMQLIPMMSTSAPIDYTMSSYASVVDSNSKLSNSALDLTNNSNNSLDELEDLDETLMASLSEAPPSSSKSSSKKVVVNCKVCFDLTPKHIFYGGQVCESCRGFFRRAVKSRKKAMAHVCHQRPVKACSRCRYDKCIEAGMLPHLVNSGKARQTTPTTSIVKVVKSAPVIEWTTEEELKVNGLVKGMKHSFFDAMSQSLTQDPMSVQIVSRKAAFGQFLDPASYKVISLSVRAIFDAAISKTFSPLLGEGGAKQLAERAFPEFYILSTMTFFSHSSYSRYIPEFVSYIQQQKDPAFNNESLRGLAATFSSMDPNALDYFMRYERVYVTPWSSSLSAEEEHKRLNFGLRAWARPGGGEDFDEALVLLMLLCCLLRHSPGDVVADMRRKWTRLLTRYLRNRYGGDKARSLLGASLSISERAVRAYEIHSQMLPV